MTVGKLRVEAPAVAPVAAKASETEVERWRRTAVHSGQQLAQQSQQIQDLQQVADELRARTRKANERLDSARTRADALMAENVSLAAERDRLTAEVAELRARIKPIDDLSRAMWQVLEDAQQRLLEQTT